MTAELIAAVKALPIEEQREIVTELTRHLGEVDPESSALFTVELDSRFKSIDEHPEQLIDWIDIKAEIARRRERQA